MKAILLRITKPLLATAAVTITVLSISFCTVKTSCSEYNNNNYFDWMPYWQNETQTFKNQNGQIETLVIATVTKSGSYTDKHRNDIPAYCKASAEITSAGQSQIKLHMLATSETDEPSAATETFNFTFRSFYLYAYAITDTGFQVRTDDKLLSRHLNEINLSGNSFSNVQEITSTDSTGIVKKGMKRIYLAKGKGVIGYQTFPDSLVYVLQ